MTIGGALVGGFIGTIFLTTAMSFASEARLTRMDLPFLLGTMVTSDRLRAKLIGYALHFVIGLLFALGYGLLFVAIGRSGWLLGAAFGLVHAAFAGTILVNVALPIVHPRMGTSLTAADSSPQLEPPGFLMRNYGRNTALVLLVAHVAYGAIVGGFAALAS
jgi:hypothetical protein